MRVKPEYLAAVNHEQADHVFKGDACMWTGKTQIIAQGLFYVYQLVEGHRKGELIYSQVKPKSLQS